MALPSESKFQAKWPTDVNEVEEDPNKVDFIRRKNNATLVDHYNTKQWKHFWNFIEEHKSSHGHFQLFDDQGLHLKRYVIELNDLEGPSRNETNFMNAVATYCVPSILCTRPEKNKARGKILLAANVVCNSNHIGRVNLKGFCTAIGLPFDMKTIADFAGASVAVTSIQRSSQTYEWNCSCNDDFELEFTPSDEIISDDYNDIVVLVVRLGNIKRFFTLVLSGKPILELRKPENRHVFWDRGERFWNIPKLPDNFPAIEYGVGFDMSIGIRKCATILNNIDSIGNVLISNVTSYFAEQDGTIDMETLFILYAIIFVLTKHTGAFYCVYQLIGGNGTNSGKKAYLDTYSVDKYFEEMLVYGKNNSSGELPRP